MANIYHRFIVELSPKLSIDCRSPQVRFTQEALLFGWVSILSGPLGRPPIFQKAIGLKHLQLPHLD